MLKLVIIALFTLLVTRIPKAQAETQWVSGTIMKSQTPVLKEPHELSEIIGTYPQGSSLIFFYPKVNHFYAIYFKGPVQENLKGWIHESQVLISPPNEPPFVPFIPLDPKAYRLDRPQPHLAILSLFNSLDYRQSTFRPFKQESLIGMLEADTPFYSDKLTLSTQLSYTLFPESTSLQGINARFFRANFEFHYHFSQTPAVRASLIGGLSYWTTSIPESAYGYKNFIAPRIYPTFEFVFSRRYSLRTLISYMPFIGRPGKGSEFMFELTLFYHRLNQQAFIARLNYSDITFPNHLSPQQTTQNTTQIGIGYRF